MINKRKKIYLCLIFYLFSSFLCLTQIYGAWEIQVVDSQGDVGLFNSIAVDQEKNIHLAYSSRNDSSLKYATSKKDRWNIQTIDGNKVGLSIDLILDTNNRPCISYYDSLKKALKVARLTDKGWHIVIVDTPVYIETSGTSIGVDLNGNICVAYCDPINKTAKYARQVVKGWKIQAIDSGIARVQDVSLAIDILGFPHISYSLDEKLKYGKLRGIKWEIKVVDDTGETGYSSSLGLTLTYPFICYYDRAFGQYRMRYAEYNGKEWKIEDVDSGFGISVATDPKGFPHISYHEIGYLANGDISYAYRDGDSWHIERIEKIGEKGCRTSIALDGEGLPHIGYYDPDQKALKYAFKRVGE